MSAIYWFSGTGNSLYAARKLSSELGGMPLYPTSSGIPAREVGGTGEKIGFVFPSYYGNLPRIVRAFVQNLRIKPDTYIFAVVTMGASQGGATANLKSVLEARSLRLDYAVGVRMAANYIMKYNPGVIGIIAPGLKSTDKAVARAAAEISKGVHKLALASVTSSVLYDDVESLDREFFTDDACTSCGLCARVCPVKNIALESGRPKWQGYCEHWEPREVRGFRRRRKFRAPPV